MILILDDPVIDKLVDKFGEKRFLDHMETIKCEKNTDVGPNCRHEFEIDLTIVNCKWVLACTITDDACPFCLLIVAHAIQNLLETL